MISPVHEESILNTVNELKYKLMSKNISKTEIEKGIFKGFNSNDLVSIYELKRILLRIIPNSECELLSRFIIEDTTNKEIQFDVFKEKEVNEVSDKLNNILGEYSIYSNDTNIKKSISEVFLSVL